MEAFGETIICDCLTHGRAMPHYTHPWDMKKEVTFSLFRSIYIFDDADL